MKLYQRYLFTSVLGAGLAAVAFFVFMLLTGNVLRDLAGLLAEGRLTWPLFGRLVAMLLPYTASFSLPMGLLAGLLMVLGRLSAQREIVAFRAAGLSLRQLAAPILLVALLGAGFCLVINLSYAPLARRQYKAVLADLIRVDPLRFIIPKSFVREFPGYVIYAMDSREGRLQHLWIWELDERQRAVRVVRAEEGEIRFDQEGDSLMLVLRQGVSEFRDQDRPDELQDYGPELSFQEARVRLPLAMLFGERHRREKLSQLGIAEIRHRLDQLRQSERDPSPPGDPATAPAQRRTDRVRLQYEIQRRYALAGSTLALAVLGIPLGIRTGRKETHANLALALLLALTYYFFLILIDWQSGRPQVRPDLLIWLPNLGCLTLGVFLFFRAERS